MLLLMFVWLHILIHKDMPVLGHGVISGPVDFLTPTPAGLPDMLSLLALVNMVHFG